MALQDRLQLRGRLSPRDRRDAGHWRRQEAPAVQSYGLDEEWNVDKLVVGEGVHGQAVIEKRAIEITDIPEDYLEASSGSGAAQPAFIYLLPFIKEEGKGLLIEVASFKKLGLDIIWNEFLDNLDIEENEK